MHRNIFWIPWRIFTKIEIFMIFHDFVVFWLGTEISGFWGMFQNVRGFHAKSTEPIFIKLGSNESSESLLFQKNFFLTIRPVLFEI